MNQNIRNPFLKYGYRGPDFFAGRVKETERIISLLRSGNNVTLISPRRMGKTGLIKNVFHRMQEQDKNAVCIYIDIFATRSFSDFMQCFASAVLSAVQSREKRLFNRLVQLLSSLRPLMTLDEMTGMPQVTVTLDPVVPETTLDQIFSFLEKSKKRCYVAFDEFQQVATYADQNAEALLRSKIQFLSSVQFIFAGSAQHIMSDMFVSARQPFFNSTTIVDLKPISLDEYEKYSAKRFGEVGTELSHEIFTEIYNRFSGHTWYVQALLHQLYEMQPPIIRKEHIELALADLVKENEGIYENIIALLTTNQFILLKAIARARQVVYINSGSFVNISGLKSVSSINTALKKLVEKEIVYFHSGVYSVYDHFFAIWLRSL